MANIPVIPGVSVATKGILNKPIKDIICAILFGGINNMLKGPLLCVTADLDEMLSGEKGGIAGDLKDALTEVRDQLKAAEAMAGIPETLARVNGAIAEVQSLLALDGMCAIPLKAPKIPDVVAQVIDAEYREMNAIINDLGRLAKPSMCLSGDGGFGPGGGYNADSILGSITKRIDNLGKIFYTVPDNAIKRLKKVKAALDKSINRQLFPDFRTKHNLVTGAPVKSTDARVITVNDFKAAAATAQLLVASVKQTGSYSIKADGIENANIWLPMLGPDVYSLAVDALTPQDPFFSQEEPIYDYCGKLVGYTSTVVTGTVNDTGGNPLVGATLEPLKTTFDFAWIQDRNCWALTGVESEQLMTVGRDTGRKGIYLDRCPTITLHRGYAHTFGIPSNAFMDSKFAPEFFVCYVDENLQPVMTTVKQKDENGKLILDENDLPMDELDDARNPIPVVLLFNQGLARLETYELLEDANGSDDPTLIVNPATGLNNITYADLRKQSNPFGTTLYFAAEQRVYSGNEEPANPDEDTWWTNNASCDTQRWTDYKSYGETRPTWDESAAIVWDEANLTNPNRFNENPTRLPSPQNPIGDWKIVTTDLNKDKKYNEDETPNKDYIPDYESHWEDPTGLKLSPMDPLLSDPKLKTPDGLWKIVTIDLNADKKDGMDYVPNYESHWESTEPGYWTLVSAADRAANWFGSSNEYNAPNANYLAYSNQDGTVFGLLKFI